MRVCTAVILAAAACTGCTHRQLDRSTLRQAWTVALNGFHSATCASHGVISPVLTNALDTKVTGNSQTRPPEVAASAKELLEHMRRFATFSELCENPAWASELEDVYEGDINRVDATVGMFAEPLPKGFGFSDTAFRIFILMASRRLRSDRFFTTDFTPQVYTPVGFRWIESNDMASVIARHYPEVAALMNPKNPFAPWPGAANPGMR